MPSLNNIKLYIDVKRWNICFMWRTIRDCAASRTPESKCKPSLTLHQLTPERQQRSSAVFEALMRCHG
ncbi:hypothetical protein ABVT39_018769 [Epinephelus coioides]